ncbi:MAG TPA: (S)-ureidoglycine aminohydrolase [Tepidisphaeraceae bacterium]|jgi:(S)-ureidoglycine aminohydrolase
MRAPNQLLHSRTRVRGRYALLPLEGFPTSRLPQWEGCDVRILAAPALGAQFVEYLIDVPTDMGAEASGDVHPAQTFGFLLSGAAQITIEGDTRSVHDGGFFFVPEKTKYSLRAMEPSRLLLLRKRYEKAASQQAHAPEPLVGNESNVEAVAFLGNEHARLQCLLPDTLSYDFAMNIFTFDPGHSLPYIETHVMEHGLFFMQGKGVYYLGDDWMEVEAGDFIWMGPYCPQCFYATGPTPSRYIYYKNVNREIPL